MSDKIKVAILVGGKSEEHNIALCSGYNLLNAIDKDKFEVVLIGIDKKGIWSLQDINKFLSQELSPKTISLGESAAKILLSAGDEEIKFYIKESLEPIEDIKVIFPMIHGRNGEDGTIQGLLEYLNLPYVGADVMSSANCMNKVTTKKMFIAAGIPTCKFIALYNGEAYDFDDIKNQLGLPLIVKPSSQGSSVGISKVENEAQFKSAIEEAFKFDNELLIEEFIVSRELECAILGNQDPIVSLPGEYVHTASVFDYETKYLKNGEVSMSIPAADLSDEKIEEVRTLALKAYKTLSCKGLSRVDTFITDSGELLVNEINTMPGFTNSSMYPILIEKMGINNSDLVTRLIELALERFEG